MMCMFARVMGRNEHFSGYSWDLRPPWVSCTYFCVGSVTLEASEMKPKERNAFYRTQSNLLYLRLSARHNRLQQAGAAIHTLFCRRRPIGFNLLQTSNLGLQIESRLEINCRLAVLCPDFRPVPESQAHTHVSLVAVDIGPS